MFSFLSKKERIYYIYVLEMFFYLQGIADLKFVIDFFRVWILSGSFFLIKMGAIGPRMGFFFFFFNFVSIKFCLDVS